jgi:hypothetical protein
VTYARSLLGMSFAMVVTGTTIATLATASHWIQETASRFAVFATAGSILTAIGAILALPAALKSPRLLGWGCVIANAIAFGYLVRLFRWL